MRRANAFASMLLLLIASVPLAVAPATTLTLPPPVRREFRDVWVATVSNIDWPSAPGLPVERQQAELIRILDLTRELNLNAIVLQVRPQCDALYASRLEPWSEYLTSRMGEPPQPFYDPLAFAVREAHARGLELHAWFNPYRALHASAKRSAAARAHTFTSRDQHAVHVVVSAVDRSGNESRPARVHK